MLLLMCRHHCMGEKSPPPFVFYKDVKDIQVFSCQIQDFLSITVMGNKCVQHFSNTGVIWIKVSGQETEDRVEVN